MKANELRIGNLILDRGEKVLRVDWFEREKICMKMVIRGTEVHPLTEEVKHLHPIPLTEEMLLKCGFENRSIGSDFWFECNEIIIGGRGKSFYPSVSGESGLEAYGYEIKSLHQLQNLFFILTGQELTVNI